MKKFFSIAMAALILGGAMTSEARDCRVNRRFDINETMNKHKRVKGSDVMESFKAKAAEHALKAKAAKVESSDSPIESCVGLPKNYIVSATSYLTFWGYVFDDTYEGMAGEVVYDETSKSAYMKNPISYLIYDTYIKGSYTDTQLSFQLPQPLLVESGETYYAHRMVKDEANSSDYDPAYNVDDSKPVTFTIAADGKITFDGSGDGVIIGLTDASGEWAGYGDYDITYEPFNKEVLTVDDMDEGFEAKLQNWMVLSDDASLSVRVAEDNGKIYIAGFNEDNADALIVGDINGTNVTFESGQYLGIDSELNYYKFFYAMSVTQEYDDWYEEYYDTYKTADKADFTYDASAGTLISQGGAIGVVGGMLDDEYGMEVYNSFNDPTISIIPDDISPLPKDPSDLYLQQGTTVSMLQFYLPPYNVDGWPLNTDNLYYRVYLKGENNSDEIFTFTPTDYVGITESFTDVAYSFECYDEDEYADIYSGLDGQGTRYVYFYFVAENPGIQAVYKDGDVEHCSNIVYADGSLGSVKDSMIGKTIASESYTDLLGRTVNAPAAGLYLKTVKYSDGTQKTTKILFK